MNYIDEIARAIYARTADDEPDESDMRLYRIYAVLASAVGEGVTEAMVHDAWSAWMADDKPEHRSLVPFEELTPDVRDLDLPYRLAIAVVAAERGLPVRPRKAHPCESCGVVSQTGCRRARCGGCRRLLCPECQIGHLLRGCEGAL